MARFYDKGINSVIPSQRAIPATLMDPKIKNRSRMWYQMANIEVAQVEGDNNWALLIDPDGFIAEGTGDNFFMIKNDCLMTPEGRNILRGISRSYVMELADQLNLECRECNIEPFDLYEADEAFLTATPFCILPTTHLNGVPIGSGQMGPITQQLLDQWSQNVGLDIVQQIRDYAKEVENWQQSNAPPLSVSQEVNEFRSQRKIFLVTEAPEESGGQSPKACCWREPRSRSLPDSMGVNRQSQTWPSNLVRSRFSAWLVIVQTKTAYPSVFQS